MSSKIICSECLKKQQEIDRLKEENIALKDRLRYQNRQISEGYFGSQTPSSKRPIKPNAPETEEKKRGGGRIGHKGHGRKSFDEGQADRVVRVKALVSCPDCRVRLKDKGIKKRAVVDIQPIHLEKILYHLEVKDCPNCRKRYTARAPGVLARSLFGNNLLTYIAVEHYLEGIPLGQLERKLGIGYGAMVKALHRMAKMLEGMPERLIKEYRQAGVKHADETGWRNDGRNGYAWLFATPKVSIFRFRQSRSAKIAKEVLGDKKLPGVLVVDRYNGYNKVPCKIQYCYAHLLRTVQDLEKEFPDNEEIRTFVAEVAPLLTIAMQLRALSISKKEFLVRAANTKSEIVKAMNAEANHAGIQKIQNIFRDNPDKLYHWAKDRNVPAENNLAERELRPIVIARKISFGSHSDAGARTREIIMTVLVTLKKKEKKQTFTKFANFLNQAAGGNDKKLYNLLFKNTPHQ